MFVSFFAVCIIGSLFLSIGFVLVRPMRATSAVNISLYLIRYNKKWLVLIVLIRFHTLTKKINLFRN